MRLGFFHNGFRSDLDEGVIIHCRFQTDERTLVSITSGPRPGTNRETGCTIGCKRKACALAQKHTQKNLQSSGHWLHIQQIQ